MRATAEAAESRPRRSLRRSRSIAGVYQALAGMDLTGADPATRYYVERTLLSFRLAGVDKDDATREKIRVLREQLEKIGQTFGRNIRDDVRKVTVESAAQLDGLPADYVAAHPAGPDGRITITTAYPDALPVLHLCAERRPAKAASHRVRQSRLSGEPGRPRHHDRRRGRVGPSRRISVLGRLLTADKMVGRQRTPRRSSIASSPHPTRPPGGLRAAPSSKAAG